MSYIYDQGKKDAQNGLGPANTHGWNYHAAEKYNAGYALNKK